MIYIIDDGRAYHINSIDFVEKTDSLDQFENKSYKSSNLQFAVPKLVQGKVSTIIQYIIKDIRYNYDGHLRSHAETIFFRKYELNNYAKFYEETFFDGEFKNILDGRRTGDMQIMLILGVVLVALFIIVQILCSMCKCICGKKKVATEEKDKKDWAGDKKIIMGCLN